MTQDWKDVLAAIGGNLPPGEETVEATSPDSGVDRKHKETLRIFLDKKGRKGKTATIIEGFEADDEEVEVIASELKRKIGTGGSARGGEILLQGDWREKVAALLREKNYIVKC